MHIPIVFSLFALVRRCTSWFFRNAQNERERGFHGVNRECIAQRAGPSSGNFSASKPEVIHVSSDIIWKFRQKHLLLIL